MKEHKELKVNALKNGTVIDHIPSNKLFKVIAILNLDTVTTPITFGTNLESKKFGSKAIIKVTDKFFEDDETNRISLIAPEARLNIIRNYEVVEKRNVHIPEKVTGIVKCVNPKCITNHEDITTSFNVVSQKPVSLKCDYCEKITDEENMEII
jgi:aspartate carbamoyltransferase regulatory subunit